MIEGGIPYTLELEMDILLIWTVCIRLGSSVLVFCANLTQTAWRAWWDPLSEDHGPCRCSGGPFRCMATWLCQHFLNKEAIDAIECPPHLRESNRAPLGRHVSIQLLSLRGTADCRGADWCPNQGLVGDPPGDHRSCHWEHVQKP